MDIAEIRQALLTHRVRISDHADEEAVADQLTYDDIRHSALNGEVIEDYPTDQPYPSCLIYERAQHGDPVHSVWAFNAATQWAVLVTVYRPDPRRWVDYRQRRGTP